MSIVLIWIVMGSKQVKKMGRELEKFLAEFNDCFDRSGPRQHLRTMIFGVQRRQLEIVMVRLLPLLV